MRNINIPLVAALAACLFLLPVAAQSKAPNAPNPPAARDCSKAPNPARCEARKKTFEACKDKPAGAERRECLRSNRPAKPTAAPGKS